MTENINSSVHAGGEANERFIIESNQHLIFGWDRITRIPIAHIDSVENAQKEIVVKTDIYKKAFSDSRPNFFTNQQIPVFIGSPIKKGKLVQIGGAIHICHFTSGKNLLYLTANRNCFG